MRIAFLSVALLSVVSASGCQCLQQIEQWKCDNWGMCHFAQQRPGVYSPMALPPSYGVPPTGLAPVSTVNPVNPVYPATGMAGAPAAIAYPTAPAAPYAGTGVPSGNCRECQN